MKRPTGVTVIGAISILQAIGTAFSLLLHGTFFSFPITTNRGLPFALAIIAICLMLAAGTGILALQPWARKLNMILAALYLLDGLVHLWIGTRDFTPFGAVFFYLDRAVAIGVAAGIILYLFSPRVRAAFKPSWDSISALR